MLPPQVEILTKQLNYKCLQKPDKKGKPAVVAHKTINRDMSPEAQDNIQPNGQPGDIFLNDSFRQENGSLQKSSKSPIQAVNVSRSPYEDIGLRDLPNKISDIRRGERFNESIKKESLAVVKKSQVPTNNAMPLKETKPVNPLSKSTVIKTINSGRKIEPVKKQLTRDKSPLAVNGAKSPLSKSPLTSSFKDKLGIKNVKTMK